MESLYRDFSTAVFTLAFRLMSHRADAEEVLQDTFVTAFSKLEQFRGDSPFGFWLRSIAVNQALMRLRQRRNQPVSSVEQVPEIGVTPISDQESRQDLERQLARLNDTARVVLWLHDVEGYTHKEIAAQMGKSVSFSKSQLARAHEKLRGWLKCHEPQANNIQKSKR